MENEGVGVLEMLEKQISSGGGILEPKIAVRNGNVNKIRNEGLCVGNARPSG